MPRQAAQPKLEAATDTILAIPPSEAIQKKDWQVFMGGLAPNSIDLVLTDPPYTISRDTGFASIGKNSVKRFAISMDFGPWDHEQIDLDSFAAACYSGLRKGGTAIIWYDLWKITEVERAMCSAGFKMIRLIIWQKTNPVPLNQSATYLSNSREVAVVGVKGGKPTFHGAYDPGIYEFPIPRHGGKRLHPTQKPDELFDALIEKHTNHGDFVVDPFLGSGTTALSARRLGRHFMGCDIDTRYVKAARRRLTTTESKNHE